MEQYIKKAAIVAEIKKLSAYLDSLHEQRLIEKILSIIDAHEVKEVDLNEEIEKCLKRNNMLAVGKKDFTDIAKHFFELGFKVSNPITAADRSIAEEIITSLKQVENDYYLDQTKEIEWVRNKVKEEEV